ncbi:MAG: SMC family ATPase [Rhodothermales bacterium]
MVPVSLKLSNFLSYGTDAPELDFNAFHVACLSGKNGQGKSALLDAMTWALWGQARKASDSRKPDEHLLRVGTLAMEVVLVFDLEATRYRVTRQYRLSASGKTPKPKLELNVYDTEQERYIPLTGSSLRETQRVINDLIGIDYDTFINSAFLMQGRSDEFTKKKPSERKEILAKVLALTKYERLSDLAMEKGREAGRSMEQAERDIERLDLALADVDEWSAEMQTVEGALTAAQERLATLRAEHQRLSEVLATLEAKQHEAEQHRASLRDLDERRQRLGRQQGQLAEKIAQAEALMAQKAEIQADYQRYEALRAERDALDEKHHIYRTFMQKRERAERDLKLEQQKLEHQTHTLEQQIRTLEQQLREDDAQLLEREAVLANMRTARAAQAEAERLGRIHEQRKQWEREVQTCTREIAQAKSALQAEVRSLTEQQRTLQTPHDREAQIEARLAKLAHERTKFDAAQAELEVITVKGQHLNERANKRAGQVEGVRKEIEKIEQQIAKVHATAETVCPTCGSPLTEQHRREVEQQYRVEQAELQAQIAEGEAWLAAQSIERAALRDTYRQHKQIVDALQQIPAEMATLEAEAQTLAERRTQAQQIRHRLATAQQALQAEAYAAEWHERLSGAQSRLDEEPFDEAQFEATKQQAAQAQLLSQKAHRLEQLAGQRDQRAASLRTTQQQLSTLRQSLDSGEALRALSQKVQLVQQQMASLGFDPKQFEQVKQRLRQLDRAGQRMQDLVNAQSNHAEWVEEHKQRGQDLTALTEAHTERAKRLHELEATLGAVAVQRQAHQEMAGQIGNVETEQSRLQVQRGQFQAKLAQAKADRAARTSARGALKEATEARQLYKHLRTAFGKHGIPSLIIEQTLPDLEERANELLDQLSDGRMHVRLETVKDKKTGGTKETLDIIITDEMGQARPYETFSGGEAFRVNFALRIALSQLLAERSGVRIRTLFIDEGFGTQDAQGVQNLVEAIQVVQDDFDKILVITHLDQLKEAFPVRIEVQKHPATGSSFSVIGG